MVVRRRFKKTASAFIAENSARQTMKDAVAVRSTLEERIDAAYASIVAPEEPLPAPSARVSVEEPEEEPDPVERYEERLRDKTSRSQIDDLVRQLREAKKRQAFIDDMGAYREPPHILPIQKSPGVREMGAVVQISDLHVEETVTAESVAGRNEYSLVIADQRLKNLFFAIEWHIKHERAGGQVVINDLVIQAGGDWITGYIHEELVETNALSPTLTVRWLKPRMRDHLATLVDHLDLRSLTVVCNPGNHGRTTPKGRISSGYANSFEWLMYCDLADDLKRLTNVRFEIPMSPHAYCELYGWWLHTHHGDEVRYMGGVGGLGIPLLKRVPQWDMVKRCDYHFIGHHHQLRDFGRAFSNGSLIGFNAYAQSIGATFEPPLQGMYLIDSRRGMCVTKKLWVNDDLPQRANDPVERGLDV